MLKGIKLRVYFNDDQLAKLPQQFGNVRFVYNKLLRYQDIYYHTTHQHMTKFQTIKLIAKMKKRSQWKDWLPKSDSIALQATAEHLENGFQKMFHHQGGHPTFKKRAYRQSYTTKNVNNNLKLVSKHVLKLPKLGHVNCATCHQPHGKIVNATIQQTPSGKYFVTLIVKTNVKTLSKTRKSIGIDLGLRYLAILSNGRKFKAFHANRLENKLKYEQRKLSRRIRQAKRIEEQAKHQFKHGYLPKDYLHWWQKPNVVKQRQYVARLHLKLANQRKDRLQKLSTWLIKHFDVIKVEALNIKAMLKNHKLAHAIAIQGWAMFINMLIYKAIWYGKTVIKVNKNYTTQDCSDCGYRMGSHDDKIEQSVKQWDCPRCGKHHDRDVNAAINIRQRMAIKTYNRSTGMLGK